MPRSAALANYWSDPVKRKAAIAKAAKTRRSNRIKRLQQDAAKINALQKQINSGATLDPSQLLASPAPSPAPQASSPHKPSKPPRYPQPPHTTSPILYLAGFCEAKIRAYSEGQDIPFAVLAEGVAQFLGALAYRQVPRR